MAIQSGNKKESGTARLVGSASAGILELLGFHPVDTIAKRLMNNKEKVFIIFVLDFTCCLVIFTIKFSYL